MQNRVGYIYKITINNPDSSFHNKFYMGRKHGNVFNSKYFGSGKMLKYYKNKYGTDGLLVEVLTWCNSENELMLAEKSIIAENLSNINCLNIHPGGKGGSGKREANGMYGKNHSLESKLKMSEIRIEYLKNNPFTKERNHKSGSANRGGHWYNNGVSSKIIKDASKVEEGWVRGKLFSEEYRNKLRISGKNKPNPVKEAWITAEHKCKYCSSLMEYRQRRNKFCSIRCSNKYRGKN